MDMYNPSGARTGTSGARSASVLSGGTDSLVTVSSKKSKSSTSRTRSRSELHLPEDYAGESGQYAPGIPLGEVLPEGSIVDPVSGLVDPGDGRLRPAWAVVGPHVMQYYDYEWGTPPSDERDMFERLSMEAFTAGLRREVVLGKRDALRVAYHNFEVDEIVQMPPSEIVALRGDASLIKNTLKISAVFSNAHATREMRAYGGLEQFLRSYVPDSWEKPLCVDDIPKTIPESDGAARALRRRGFSFLGSATILQLFFAMGMLDGRVVGAAELLEV